MRAKVPPLPARQVSLFPKARSEEEKLDDLRPELIEALADLLLEALGDDRGTEGGDLESEDHR
jgi:hypothetical protein